MIASLQPPRRTSKSISPTRERPECLGCQTAAVRIRQLEKQVEKMKLNDDMKSEFAALNQAEQLARLQRELELKAENERKGVGMRMLRQILARRTKGELGLRLEVWRMALRVQMRGMRKALETQMKAQGQGAGLRMLRQIMARQTKGELGLRIEVWRTGCQDGVRGRELDRERRALAEQADNAAKGAGLRQLKQILARLAKGEVASLVEVWRQGGRMAAYDRQVAIARELDAKMRTQGRGAGIKMLRQIVARQVRGELGLRLEVFRTAHRLATSRQGVDP